MKLEKIEAGACDTGPEKNCVLNSAAHSTRASETQPRTIPPVPNIESGITLKEWRDRLVREGFFKAVEVVGGDLGPIALIGTPLVCVGFGDSWTVVWMERQPWGWSDPNKIFLAPRSKAACRYAVELGERVRKAAQAQQARNDRAMPAYLREKFGGVK